MRIPFLLAALLMMLSPSPPAAAADSPTLKISPKKGQAGTTVTYVGKKYAPGAEVTVVIGADGIILTTTRADGEGRIAGEFDAPEPADITGFSGDDVVVFAVEMGSGRESERATFRYRADWSEASGDQQMGSVELSFSVDLGAAEISAETTLWALYGLADSSPSERRLTDPESDGTYTFSTEVPLGTSLRASVIKANGTRDTATGPTPGDGVVVLRDWGEITVLEDTVLDLQLEDIGGGEVNMESVPGLLPNTGTGTSEYSICRGYQKC